MPENQPRAFKNERVGFVGLGNMGGPMADNLSVYLAANSLPALTLWNRTTSKLPPVSATIQHSASLRQLAKDCDIVITSVSSDHAAREVYKELLEGAREKEAEKKAGGKSGITVFCETSTLYPTTSGELERETAAIPHTYFLQTPVFGPPPLAKKAQLVVVLSGDHFAKAYVKDFLVPSMGRKFIDVGSNVERAAAFKLNGNFLILGIVELLAESMTLADKTGVGADLLFEFIKEFIPAPSFAGYGNRIIKNDFEDAGFTVVGGLKDANHIRHLAASVDAVVPIIDIAHQHLITSKANGGEHYDWSSLVAGPRMAAGLLPFTGLKPVERDNGFGAKVERGGKEEEPQRVGGIKEVRNF